MNFAPGTRTWQFAQPLVDDGHSVCVATARIPGAYQDRPEPVVEQQVAGVLVYSMDREIFDESRALEELVAAFDPDVVIGAATIPALAGANIAGGRPLWVDLFGDPLAEAQAREARCNDGDSLTAYQNLLAALLRRGDVFSTVSERQRYCAIGQLGLAGRLNRASNGYEYVYTIPCCVFDERSEEPREKRPELDDVDPDDIVLLWSGGFNTWCDVETLFNAIEAALAVRSHLRFVATGGEIAGHDTTTYARLKRLVQSSRNPSRYVLKGCIPQRQAARYRARADLGIVTEMPIYERELGSSGRMLDWLSVGLPFICSSTSEIADQLDKLGLVFTYPPGDAAALGEIIIEATDDLKRLRDVGAKASDIALQCWGLAASTEPLRRWLHDPQRAPDAGYNNHLLIINQTEATELLSRIKKLDALNQEGREALGHIHRSRMWKFWMGYLRMRQWLYTPVRLVVDWLTHR